MSSRRNFTCSSCGHTQVKFFGICPGCGEGGSAVEQADVARPAGRPRIDVAAAEFAPLESFDRGQLSERVETGIGQLDRVLGGGYVQGSYIILGAAPGSGKSTLATQVLGRLSERGLKVGLVCGEESPAQVRMRFERLGVDGDKVLVTQETGVERITAAATAHGLDLLCIDSIQTVFSEGSPGVPGSPGQIRECGQALMRLAKHEGVTLLVIGQVTKEGDLAGPRMLEHMVDVVLAIEGDQDQQLRLLRASKNRFGSTDELGVFQMTSEGLEGVDDPSALFVTSRPAPAVGAVNCPIIEGSRPLTVEVQALVNPSNMAQPIRACRGIDTRRFQMLLAVLSRKCGLRLGSCDVFLQLAGGLKSEDPALDLACCLAVASAYTRRPPRADISAFGEVTLLGEVRPTAQHKRRKQEASQRGTDLIVEHGMAPTVAQALECSLGAVDAAEVSLADQEDRG